MTGAATHFPTVRPFVRKILFFGDKTYMHNVFNHLQAKHITSNRVTEP
jgi:hypothetical protein